MKKIIIYLPILCFSFSVSAQELNEAFLNTLPANIRADFKNADDEDRTKNFVNPDTRVKKLESALEDVEVTLSQIKADLNQDKDKSFELKRFGETIFNSFQSTFLPVNTPNPSADYILDSGDALEIQLIGNKNSTQKLTISRNGQIQIKDVGVITLSGLTLEQAISSIRAKISSVMVGVESFVSLSSVRDINVLIVGLVPNPGMYTLSGGSTPLSLLMAAGGISEEGSYRKIIHKRNSEILQVIDLYDIFIRGDLSLNFQLRSGDVLLVEPKYPEVRVFGNFSNPAIFEFTPDEKLIDVLNFAKVKNHLPLKSLSISRFHNNSQEILNVLISDAHKFDLRHSDTITAEGINPSFDGTLKVTLTGEVKVPGEYIIPKNTRLSKLIDQAGGYTDYAYPEMGSLQRLSARKIELEARNKSYDEIIRYIVASPNFSQILTGPDSNGIVTFLSLLKDYQPSGRIVTNFNLETIKRNPNYDRVLEDQDKIHLPSFKPEVYLLGEVINPGSYIYQDDKDFLYYIQQAGGLTRIADNSRIIVIGPNGNSRIIKQSNFKFFRNSENLLLPGSTIYIPTTINKLDGINLAATVAPIVSSVALSLASLNSINN